MQIKADMEDTTGAETGRFPILTATTDRGCILFIHPLQMSLSIMITLTTFMEPEVDEAQPPMNISIISTS